MKRIVFSIWQDTDWRDYKDILISKQREYADFCNADYHCIEYDSFTHDRLQFEKLDLADKYLDSYDEVLYLDLDVIPRKSVSFFDKHDLNTFCIHYTDKPQWKIDAKNAALGFAGKNRIANTGVFGLSKKLKGMLKTPHVFNNNEVFVSHTIEKYNIPCTELTGAWNFILDSNFRKYSAAHYFLHVSNKDFDIIPLEQY